MFGNTLSERCGSNWPERDMWFLAGPHKWHEGILRRRTVYPYLCGGGSHWRPDWRWGSSWAPCWLDTVWNTKVLGSRWGRML